MSEELSQDEIATLGEKIAGFAASLSDRERDAFAAAMWNGESADVEGFSNIDPIGKNFIGLKFTPGASVKAFPSLKHSGPVSIKPSAPN